MPSKEDEEEEHEQDWKEDEEEEHEQDRNDM